MTYTYKYPRVALTADIMIFRKKEANTQLLLIQRKYDPFKGMWALPGGFIEMEETLIQAAIRELKEETGLNFEELSFLNVFDKLDRDPRGRTISAVFYGFLEETLNIKAGDDASQAQWFSIGDLPDLAFDHQEIIDFGFKNIVEIKK
jgi:8-oxo-dGTP diphosphatase